MFPFQAIHNCNMVCAASPLRCQRAIINVSFSSNSQLQGTSPPTTSRCQRAIINVSFSSNSQPNLFKHFNIMDVKELLSMFPFQAIHNFHEKYHGKWMMSKSYYQCFLFKQFTTEIKLRLLEFAMSKSYYQCFLFKQFTTFLVEVVAHHVMSKSYYQCFLFKQFTTDYASL